MVRSGHDPRGLSQLVEFATEVGFMPITGSLGVVSELSRCDWLFAQASDLAVAKSVVDEREKFAGHCDTGLVLAAPFGDPMEIDSEPLATVVADHRFQRGPTHDRWDPVS